MMNKMVQQKHMGSSTAQVHYVVFIGNTLYPWSTSLHPEVYMYTGTREYYCQSGSPDNNTSKF